MNKINEYLTDKEVIALLGERIKKIRINKEITGEELAKKAGLTKTTISNIENGENSSLLNFIKIIRVLDSLENLEKVIPENEYEDLSIDDLKSEPKIYKRFKRKVK